MSGKPVTITREHLGRLLAMAQGHVGKDIRQMQRDFYTLIAAKVALGLVVGCKECIPCGICGGVGFYEPCMHLADSKTPADNLEEEPCDLCGLYFADD